MYVPCTLIFSCYTFCSHYTYIYTFTIGMLVCLGREEMMEKLRFDKMVAVAVAAVVAVTAMVVMGEDLHRVGGSKGWRPDVNYSDWFAHEKTVYVGDWLIFYFDKRYYNVLEVNKTSYEKCIDRDFIKNVTRGGRDVVHLTEPRAYYFLSSGGYCFHQMRVAINVVAKDERKDQPAPILATASPSAPSQYSASSTIMFTCIWIVLVNVVYVSLFSENY
ncbi:Lamin-like protein [Arachis hypogaea]|nr:Lamin-like protein [Arachis hypogaea]